MKKFGKFMLASVMSVLLVLPAFAACGGNKKPDDDPPDDPPVGEFIDYVANLKLDLSSNTKKQEVTVKQFIDGDTTHFDPVKNSTLTSYNASDFADTYGYIKARYLAVNTPESTGDVEKWGKTASNFTHDKLDGATIIVESDDDKWNMDSNNRYTLWIWYAPKGVEAKAENFRNLNVELLQNGYGLAQNTATNRYGEQYAMPALNQAKEHKLKIYSNEHDENYYEGEAIQVTLKKLRCHIDEYVTKVVRIEGVVTTQMDNNVYIEDYDAETGLYFGIVIFYGFTPTPTLRTALTIGNRVSVCGTVSYSDGFGYQINGVTNNPFHPENTDNTVVVKDQDGNPVTGTGGFPELNIKDVAMGTRNIAFPVVDEDGNETEEQVPIKYGEAVLNTTATFSNLKVVDLYTTKDSENNTGAISITCQQLDASGNPIKDENGKAVEIVVRTTPLYVDGALVSQEIFRNKIITAKGIIEKFDGEYQLKVHVFDYITIIG